MVNREGHLHETVTEKVLFKLYISDSSVVLPGFMCWSFPSVSESFGIDPQGFTLTEIWWSRSGDLLQKVSRPTEKLVARIF